jgi:hypothetical protein
MQAYLSGAMQWKDKEKGIKYAFDHLRKYHDAVLKCAEYAHARTNCQLSMVGK